MAQHSGYIYYLYISSFQGYEWCIQFFTRAVCRVFQGLGVQFHAGALACSEAPSYDDFPVFGEIKNIWFGYLRLPTSTTFTLSTS